MVELPRPRVLVLHHAPQFTLSLLLPFKFKLLLLHLGEFAAMAVLLVHLMFNPTIPLTAPPS